MWSPENKIIETFWVATGHVNVLECMRFRVAIGQGKVLECMRFNLCGLWSQLHCLLWTLPLVSWFHLLCIYAIAGWWFAIYRSPVAEGKKTFIRQPRQFLNFTQLTWLLPHINTAPYKWQPVELSSEQPSSVCSSVSVAVGRSVQTAAVLSSSGRASWQCRSVLYYTGRLHHTTQHPTTTY